MFAIFQNNEYIKNSDIPDPVLKSLEIGKDIQWQFIIRRGGEIIDIEKKDLEKDDIILKRYWKVENLEITRNGKRKTIKEKDLKDGDKIEQKNYSKKSKDDITGYRVCRGGASHQIEVKDMQKGDIVEKEFEKERIYINVSNEFLLKTDQELIDEYKIKIMNIFTETITNKSIIDNTAKTEIADMQTQVDALTTLIEVKELYNNVLVKQFNT